MSSHHKIWIITLFPEFFQPLQNCGIVGQVLRGQRGASITLQTVSLRDFSDNDYKGVDDSPYGGGPGMVLRADILKKALLKGVVGAGNYGENFRDKLHIISPGPKGERWNNTVCKKFSQAHWSDESQKDLVFICGRYEGIDERFIKLYVDQEISVGDFILSGGELAVQVLLDSALRFCPGTLGNKNGANADSFHNNLLEHGLYTRPKVFDGLAVPEVLTGGNHQKIKKYQTVEQVEITKKLRPDLFEKYRSKR